MTKSFNAACGVYLCLLFAIALVTAGPLQAQTPPPSSTPPLSPADYDFRWGVKIPMRDKVELNATLYLPKTQDGSLPKTPVIFTLTPYISIAITRAAHILHRMAMHSRSSTFAAAEIPAANSSRL